jgi:hypothetical protein
MPLNGHVVELGQICKLPKLIDPKSLSYRE